MSIRRLAAAGAGLKLSGDGSTWIDGVSLEDVDPATARPQFRTWQNVLCHLDYHLAAYADQARDGP